MPQKGVRFNPYFNEISLYFCGHEVYGIISGEGDGMHRPDGCFRATTRASEGRKSCSPSSSDAALLMPARSRLTEFPRVTVKKQTVFEFFDEIKITF
jgi:hypothetical protein